MVPCFRCSVGHLPRGQPERRVQGLFLSLPRVCTVLDTYMDFQITRNTSSLLFTFSIFIFQLQLTFNIILYQYQFQIYSIVSRHLYNLQNDPPDIPSAHLVPHIVITKHSYSLYSPFLCLLCNYQFILLQSPYGQLIAQIFIQAV